MPVARHRRPHSVRDAQQRSWVVSLSIAGGAVLAAATTTAGAHPSAIDHGDSSQATPDNPGSAPLVAALAAVSNAATGADATGTDTTGTTGIATTATEAAATTSGAATGSTASGSGAGVQPVSPDAPAGASIPGLLAAAAPANNLIDNLREATVREAERAAAEAEALRPKTFVPVSGTLTSGSGPRWGTTHYGLDIANAIGTPIVAVTDGTVIEAGPASGFGLWVRVAQDDGTIGVFGHIDQALVVAGQRVRAGETIATVGNRGQSTGPHLHYEVWEADGTKTAPMAWLNSRGIQL